MKKEHVEVLLEDIRSTLRVVAESQVGLQQRMDRQEQQTDARFSEMHDFIRVVAQDFNGKIAGVEQRLSAKIDGVANDLAEHRADTEVHAAVR